MACSLFRLTWASLLSLCLAAPGMAQSYVERIDVAEIPEVDVLFKCHGDAQTPEAALFGLAHRLSRRKHRVYSVLMSSSDSRFGYVSAPYAISAPAFFERDGIIYACVTVQSLKSLEFDDDEVSEPGADAPDSVDDSLDDAVDGALPPDPNESTDPNDVFDPNQLFDPNDVLDPNAYFDDFNRLVPGDGDALPYDEEDDLKIPKFGDSGAVAIEPEAEQDAVYLDANNATDLPFFDPNDRPIIPPAAPPGPTEPDVTPAPAPAPAADKRLLSPDTATAPQAEEQAASPTPPVAPTEDAVNDPAPIDPALPTGLPGLEPVQAVEPPSNPSASNVSNNAEPAVTDAQTDALPAPDATHGPIVRTHQHADPGGALDEPASHILPPVETAPPQDNASLAHDSESDGLSPAPSHRKRVSRADGGSWPILMSLLTGF